MKRTVKKVSALLLIAVMILGMIPVVTAVPAPVVVLDNRNVDCSNKRI